MTIPYNIYLYTIVDMQCFFRNHTLYVPDAFGPLTLGVTCTHSEALTWFLHATTMCSGSEAAAAAGLSIWVSVV